LSRLTDLPQVWGHRGASAAKRENTIDAFREAVRMGADGVELDVRRSRDHAMVVHHDEALRDGRPIRELTVADLPREVPLLHAALDACDGMLVNIEIKNVEVDGDHDPEEYLAGAVVSLVNERTLHPQVLVSSFSLATIDRVRDLDGDIRTGYLASGRWDQMKALGRAIEGGHDAFHPFDLVVSAELVAAAHDAGIDVNVWTVDDPDRIRWLAELGVDAIITNVPDIAIEALKRG
jgi:glycerophosphoryl diester phosphodiesterase